MFKDIRNLYHLLAGVCLMQLINYFSWLAFGIGSKTLPFQWLADLYNEGHGNIGGLVTSCMLVAFAALIVELIEMKVSPGTDLSVPDILVTALGGALWYFVPLTDSLGATITAALGLVLGALYLLKSK